MARLVGFLYSCETPECGGVDGYFCVRCRHYVTDCRCSRGWCECRLPDGTCDDSGWASKGERRFIKVKLATLDQEAQG